MGRAANRAPLMEVSTAAALIADGALTTRLLVNKADARSSS